MKTKNLFFPFIFGILFAYSCSEQTKPTLYLAGDSTVANGNRETAGWGKYLDTHFDSTKIDVKNWAVGGTSSRTYRHPGKEGETNRKMWDSIMAYLKPGDFVMIQFGHNDGSAVNDSTRARGTLKGIGDESVEIDNIITGKHETVYSYGWYLKQYIDEARSKGAEVIVCSPIPRNRWTEEKVNRDSDSYTQWAESIAEFKDVDFINLNYQISELYDSLGKEKVNELYFTENDQTHTSFGGAEKNAEIVADGISKLKRSDLKKYMR